jgi:hypothetical protein
MNEELKKVMTNNDRKRIAKRCRNTEGWEFVTESEQDKLIGIVCGYSCHTLVDFFAADGHFLNKILRR